MSIGAHNELLLDHSATKLLLLFLAIDIVNMHLQSVRASNDMTDFSRLHVV